MHELQVQIGNSGWRSKMTHEEIELVNNVILLSALILALYKGNKRWHPWTWFKETRMTDQRNLEEVGTPEQDSNSLPNRLDTVANSLHSIGPKSRLSQKQRICLIVGALLLALTALYPPWARWLYGERRFEKYGFLFDTYLWPHLHWPILLNEWLTIASVTGGLFLIFADKTHPTPTTRWKRRSLFWLTLVLVVLVACLTVSSISIPTNHRNSMLYCSCSISIPTRYGIRTTLGHSGC
jgi:hypothetical protein